MQTESLLDLYFNWLGRHRKPKTVQAYRQRLARFRDRFAGRELSEVGPLEIEDWLANESTLPNGKEAAPDTVRLTIAAWRAFESWSIERKELPERIIGKIEKPAGRRRERLPTDEERERLLEVMGPALSIMYRALRQSGARPSELCGATVDSIDRERGVIILEDHKTARKTGKPRVIPIGRRLRWLIKKSLAGRDSGPLFVTSRGSAWSAGGLSAAFRRARQRAGVADDVVLYSSRHEHATALCRTFGIQAAADALGHSDLRTTQRYVHSDDEQLRANQDGAGL